MKYINNAHLGNALYFSSGYQYEKNVRLSLSKPA